jgi:hypothetical protein
VAEQQKRVAERIAYERTSELANQLGLNEEDRAGLYQYLYENPEATHEDISQKLVPELRELMPKDRSKSDAGGSISVNVETSVE